MTTASLCVDRRNSWTGTRGNTPTVIALHAPNSDTEKKIARSALEFVLQKKGTEEAQQMTLGQMIEFMMNN